MVSGTGINRQSIDIEFYSTHDPNALQLTLFTDLGNILSNVLEIDFGSGNHAKPPLTGGIGILNTAIVNMLQTTALFSLSIIEPTGNYDTRKIDITFRELDPFEVTNLGNLDPQSIPNFGDGVGATKVSELLDLPNLHVILRESMATQLKAYFEGAGGVKKPLGGYIVKKLDNISIDYGGYDLIVANETNLTPISMTSDNNQIAGSNWVISGDGVNKANLTSVVLSDTVEQIQTVTQPLDPAFSEALNLHTVILRENLFSIQRNAFEGCIKLKNIIFPGSIRFLGYASFQNCGFGQITFQRAPENESSLILQTMVDNVYSATLDQVGNIGTSEYPVGNSELRNCFTSSSTEDNLHMGYLNITIANDRKTHNVTYDLSSPTDGN